MDRIKSRIFGRDGRGPGPTATAELLQEATETGSVLMGVFGEVCSGAGNAGRCAGPHGELMGMSGYLRMLVGIVRV